MSIFNLPEKIENSAMKLKTTLITLTLIAVMGLPKLVAGQPFPGQEESIPYLITFGKNASKNWGDDDFCQIFFFSIPKEQKTSIYIRVFDPDVGGGIDEIKGDFNTRCRFSIFGGRGAISNKASREEDPVPGFDSGTLLVSKTFGVNEKYDNGWYTFGPFNPTEGEWGDQYGGYVFKVVAQGISGDDGNLYKYFLSTSPTRNVAVEGGNAFTFEYSFRLPNEPSVCHIYPYITPDIVSIMQYNFDWDNDGIIKIISPARRGELVETSNDGDWKSSKHMIQKSEHYSSMDFRIVKKNNYKNNNVVFRITNQYGEAMPFYSAPIGGVPKFRLDIGAEKINDPKK